MAGARRGRFTSSSSLCPLPVTHHNKMIELAFTCVSFIFDTSIDRYSVNQDHTARDLSFVPAPHLPSFFLRRIHHPSVLFTVGHISSTQGIAYYVSCVV